MAAAVGVVAFSGRLEPVEIAGVLLRDIVATVAFAATFFSEEPRAIPARWSGKAVTVAQILTLVAFLLNSPYLRPIAWATTVIAVFAIWDYQRVAPRAQRGSGADAGDQAGVLNWQEGLRFAGGAPDGPSTTIDGDNAAAPGPMLTLLLAAASCSGSDVVLILQKMRVQLRELRIDVTGVRREQEPRRYAAIHFDYHLGGEGLDQAKADPGSRPLGGEVLLGDPFARARYRHHLCPYPGLSCCWRLAGSWPGPHRSPRSRAGSSEFRRWRPPRIPALAVAGMYGGARTSARTRVSAAAGAGFRRGEAALRGEMLGHFLLSPEQRRGAGLLLRRRRGRGRGSGWTRAIWCSPSVSRIARRRVRVGRRGWSRRRRSGWLWDIAGGGFGRLRRPESKNAPGNLRGASSTSPAAQAAPDSTVSTRRTGWQ